MNRRTKKHLKTYRDSSKSGRNTNQIRLDRLFLEELYKTDMMIQLREEELKEREE